jgi:hypothetical protein
MMREARRIRDQLRRALEGDAWHGPSLRELLADGDAELAARVPHGSAHGIWQIVLHITTWLTVPRLRLAGQAIEPDETDDWPEVGAPTEERWRAAVASLENAGRALLDDLDDLDDARLEEIVPGRTHDVYTLLHGAIQHALYHAGQIALLKRLQG